MNIYINFLYTFIGNQDQKKYRTQTLKLKLQLFVNSKHLVSSDFINPAAKTKRLKDNAVPSLFSWSGKWKLETKNKKRHTLVECLDVDPCNLSIHFKT